jgi:hypothetical protein
MGCHHAHSPPAKRDAAPPPPVDAAAVEKPVPDAAKAPPVPTKIAVAGGSACAVMSDATVRCWGSNAQGQLGDGTTRDAKELVQPKLLHVVDVALADGDACALLDDGSVACWGAIGFGPGRGSASAPTAVAGVTGGKHLFVFPGAGCTSVGGGPLVCWGDVDARGHLGASGAHRVPTPVPGVSHVIAVTPHGVLQEDGTVRVWSASGAAIDAGLSGVTELASWGNAVCGLRGDGTVACVGPELPCAAPPPAPHASPARGKHGSVKRGKRGRGKPAAPPKPAPPPKPAGPPQAVLALPRARHLAFDAGLCVVTTDGRLACLDTDHTCAPEPSWPGLSHVVSVSGACARLHDGTVRCWSASQRTAHPLPGIAHATQLAASASLACILIGDGLKFVQL